VARGRLIAVEGASAAGKTTLVSSAARRYGWQALPEAFDRLDPTPSLEFHSARGLLRLEGLLLAEESRRYREARRVLRRGGTVLADTGFLGPVTYTWGLVRLGQAPASVARRLEESARVLVERGVLGIPDLTVYLGTTVAERRRRARADPDRHPAALASRHEAVGRVERSLFETALPAALPERFRTLLGRGDPRTLVARLRAEVDSSRPVPASRAEARVVLSRLRPPAGGTRGKNAGPNR
jgi:AAA domain